MIQTLLLLTDSLYLKEQANIYDGKPFHYSELNSVYASLQTISCIVFEDVREFLFAIFCVGIISVEENTIQHLFLVFGPLRELITLLQPS